MYPIGAVIFDMDGVLVHSNPIHTIVLKAFCKEHGYDLSDAYLKEHIYGRTNQDWITALFGDIPQKKKDALAHQKEQMFRDAFNPKEHVVSGIFEFLEVLNVHGIKMAVATSAPKENADHILHGLTISHYFEVVLNSSHVTKSKPNPEPYLKAAKALGELPEKCIVFEDSISGVESGLAAGAKVVGIATTHTHKELEHCHLVVDDFTELCVADLEKLVG